MEQAYLEELKKLSNKELIKIIKLNQKKIVKNKNKISKLNGTLENLRYKLLDLDTIKA